MHSQRLPMKWFKLIAINSAILLLLLILIFAGGEVYYRYIYDDTDSFALAKTTKHWLKKHYRLNNFSMRDDQDYFATIAKDKTRITFIGDSFTAGHGIEDVNNRFANILRNNKPDWEIQTFGVNGFDTGDQIKLLDDVLSQGFQLDWVVLIYTLNDISDITPAWKTIVQRLYYPENRPGFFIQNSWFANTLYYRFMGTTDDDISSYFNFVTGAYNSSIWDVHKNRLRQMQQMVKSHGGRLLVVTFPFMHVTNNNSYRMIHEKLDFFWREQGIPHLDMSPVFQQYTPKELTVNRFDAHPNEFAHSLAATSINSFITNEMLRNVDSGRRKEK